MNTDLLSTVTENALFVLEFLGLVIAVFLIAYIFDKCAKKKDLKNGHPSARILSTKTIVVTGMFSAISTILMLLDFPVPFAPSFYKLDFSELPALIAGFAYGPVAGVMVEFIKLVLKVLFKGTSTAFVGELANFVIGCGLILPASIIYRIKKTKKTAVISCIVGTIMITVIGSVFNAVYLLPAFCKLYGMPMEAIIGMGTKINPSITSVSTLVIFAVAPLNLIKGLINSVITILIYKHLSKHIKSAS